MNDCSWQKNICRPSAGGMQDCIWPQSFSLSVYKELTKTTIEEKEEGELDLCLSTVFNKGRA